MINVFARVDAVGFADDQGFGPGSGIAFSFQRFDQAQKAVFEFECLVIENFDWRDGQKQLATLAAALSAIVAFAFLVRVF